VLFRGHFDDPQNRLDVNAVVNLRAVSRWLNKNSKADTFIGLAAKQPVPLTGKGIKGKRGFPQLHTLVRHASGASNAIRALKSD
jgi:hypothetical protein